MYNIIQMLEPCIWIIVQLCMFVIIILHSHDCNGLLTINIFVAMSRGPLSFGDIAPTFLTSHLGHHL
jgi:hypothetical protein